MKGHIRGEFGPGGAHEGAHKGGNLAPAGHMKGHIRGKVGPGGAHEGAHRGEIWSPCGTSGGHLHGRRSRQNTSSAVVLTGYWKVFPCLSSNLFIVDIALGKSHRG